MIKRFDVFLLEKVNATVLYATDRHIDSVISGERDVAFVYLDDADKKRIKEAGLNVRKVEQQANGKNIDYDNDVYVVYSDIDKANILFNVLRKHGGFLTDNTPEEAIENGRALEYDENSINEFIRKKYNTTIEEVENR